MNDQDNHLTEDKSVYHEFVSAGERAVQSIRQSIEKRLFELEKRTFDIKKIYDDIDQSIAYLESLYYTPETIHELEYIKKLRSHVSEHRKSLGSQHTSFNIIHFLLEKIHETDQPEDEMNRYNHSAEPHQDNDMISDLPFKWVSYTRSGSQFLVGYDTLLKLPTRVVAFTPESESFNNTIEYKGFQYQVIDPFLLTLSSPPSDPSYYLIVSTKNSVRCFAADSVSKRFFAKRDFVTEKIRPYRVKSSFSPGYVTLEGIRHIFIQ